MPATQQRCAYCEVVESQAALDLVAAAVRQGSVVYAPCAGVRVLAAADVLQGRSVTGSSSFKSEYEAAGAEFLAQRTPPVVDGNLVTAVRGLYNHVKNCETIAVTLESLQDNAASAREVRPGPTCPAPRRGAGVAPSCGCETRSQPGALAPQYKREFILRGGKNGTFDLGFFGRAGRLGGAGAEFGR